MKFILYQGTNDRLWLSEQGQPIFCVDDRGIEFVFRPMHLSSSYFLARSVVWNRIAIITSPNTFSGAHLLFLSILDTLSEETYSYEV